MELSFRYRLYPNKAQKALINKTFGCVRFVYNHYLYDHEQSYAATGKTMSYVEQSRDLTQLKQQLTWLQDVDKWSLCNALRDLDRNFQAFFRKQKPHPTYRSKKDQRRTYRTTFTNNNIAVTPHHLKLPKLGKVKARGGRLPIGRILNATIIRLPSDKYIAEVCCTDINESPKTSPNKCIGLDFGVKNFITTSENTIVNNPFYLKQELKVLSRLQRSLSRKPKGSKNHEKARIKLARFYERITNKRRDFTHKLSRQLVSDYDVICIEDISMQDLISEAKSHTFARYLSDICWYIFTEELKYKCRLYGKSVVKVNRYFPSSQICNQCGFQASLTKDLSVRIWECPECHSILDRDYNAALNILTEGLKLLSKNVTVGTTGLA